MTTVSYDFSPEVRAAWGDGPWQQEPCRVEWRHGGLPCLILRVETGHLSGYVAVPPGHVLHGKSLDVARDYVNPHGGVTLAHGPDEYIRHAPEPGEPTEVWWIGFDCMHGFDYVPAIANLLRRTTERLTPEILAEVIRREDEKLYRDIAFVTAEVNRLVEQLAALQ